MADLPKQKQVNTSFDMLYTLAKKLEVRQPSCTLKTGWGSTDTYYPALTERVATLKDEELFPLDPEIQGTEAPDAELPELNQIEGLNMRMTQAMNHYQQEELRCFMCGATDYFVWDCPHWEMFRAWHREHLNSKGVGPKNKEPAPINHPPQK